MLVYPVLHFIYSDGVASIVPPWIPWHLFWTYFTAISIMAAGVAIVLDRQVTLAATLLGLEILLFVALIHVRLLFHEQGDPWAERAMFGDSAGRWINCFKDFGLSGAVLILAGSRPAHWRVQGQIVVLSLAKAILTISVFAFGILHFIYPVYAPGIPPMLPGIAFPIPGHLFWVYATAVVLMGCAAGIALNRAARPAAIILGAMILGFDLLTWTPIFVRHPMELTGNWLKDVGIAGGAWVLAGYLSRQPSQAEVPELAVPVSG